MGITAKQRQERQKYLGSSDMPAIMGFSRFANAYDVWLYKTGRIAEDPKERDYQTAGNMFEDGVLRWAVENPAIDLGQIKRNQERTIDGLPMKVHIDAIEVDTGMPVEAKTEGLFGPIIEPWGDTGTDEVPEYTCIQAHCHMMATDRELCHVPTFLGGRGYGYFFVRRDPDIIDMIREQAVMFWNKHVLNNVPPPDVAPTLELVKRIRHIEGEPVELQDEIVKRWQDLNETKKQAAKAADAAKALVLANLDGNEIGECGLGTITNHSQERKGYTVERTSFRVLRFKKQK